MLELTIFLVVETKGTVTRAKKMMGMRILSLMFVMLFVMTAVGMSLLLLPMKLAVLKVRVMEETVVMALMSAEWKETPLRWRMQVPCVDGEEKYPAPVELDFER
jgi:hypothetical protein